MKLHEYQAKTLFKEYGIPVPDGDVAKTPEEAREVAKKLMGDKFVVKAQVQAGGRGKAGGVRVVSTAEEVFLAAQKILGMRLVSKQTGPEGRLVKKILVERGLEIKSEMYCAFLIDRSKERVSLIFSTAGGMDIEEVAEQHPDKIRKIAIDPVNGLQPYIVRDLVFYFGINPNLSSSLYNLLSNMYKMFIEKDLSLIEINPLVITDRDELMAIDAKVNVEDNALFRQKALAEMRDPDEEDQRERIAHQYNLNYISLSGNIGCLVNGAGLAMATMDIIKYFGGEPANFLDIGGGANKQSITEGFKLILSDPKVRGILVNIFGGIVKCDLVAQSVIEAVKEMGISVPLVVRLEGTNAEQAREIIRSSGIKLYYAQGMSEAAEMIVKLVT
ncbi:MAG: ADP-forming succinate--CoA ligase subunit beta [Deltaproteobacteria bacterium]|nr:ADP-forming succinate--CoA ligase subunit beta [Deltaproteobacteria bacterium]